VARRPPARTTPELTRPLAGRAALVTGAAGGIGGAVAAALSSAGAGVFGVDLAGADHDADLTVLDEAQGAVRAAVARLGRLDVVVNAAGLSGRRFGDGPVDVCTEEAWDRVLAGNLKSVYLVSKFAVPELLAAGGGSIVNVSSVLGLVGGDEDWATHAYAASKGGVIALTRAMAVAYAADGIRANVLCPAVIDTAQGARVREDPRLRARLRELQPLTGDLGRPEDVAAAALFLAGPESSFVTGAVVPVDGGWTAR
jgi:NAD(P)-dependent dehydrogenase (short-subunit alcohol dehydrogenase family)